MVYLQHFPVIKIKVKVEEGKKDKSIVKIKIKPAFKWSIEWNKNFEKYWIIIHNETKIIKTLEFILKQEDIEKKSNINIEIDLKGEFKLLLISDSWIGIEQCRNFNLLSS